MKNIVGNVKQKLVLSLESGKPKNTIKNQFLQTTEWKTMNSPWLTRLYTKKYEFQDYNISLLIYVIE